MTGRAVQRMRRYWDAAATRNAAWYVDTSLDYDDPDMERFLDGGRRIVEQALGQAPARPVRQESAVEIGAGLGRVCLALAEHFDHVVGLDISPEMVSRAERLVDRPNVRFLVGDGRTLKGVADDSVDLVVSFTVFQHIPDPAVVRSYLTDVARVLRPGGILAMQWNSTPGRMMWRLQRWVTSAAARAGRRGDRYGRDAPEFLGSRIPASTIAEWLRRDGLRLEAVRDEGTLFTWGWARKPGMPCG